MNTYTGARLFPGPVYTLNNGRTFQINRYNAVFCVSDIQPDPHLPGCSDITEAICSPTWLESLAVEYLKKDLKPEPDQAKLVAMLEGATIQQ